MARSALLGMRAQVVMDQEQAADRTPVDVSCRHPAEPVGREVQHARPWRARPAGLLGRPAYSVSAIQPCVLIEVRVADMDAAK